MLRPEYIKKMHLSIGVLWIYVITTVTGRPSASNRVQNSNIESTNDITLDFGKLASLGKTDRLIEELKEIAQRTHSCGIKEVPNLRRVYISNSSVTCNDGSPAAFYIRKSYGSTKWIVFLEGGWYCFDNYSCRQRWLDMQNYMSSKHWPEVRTGNGILSWDPEENPYYFHSNMVYIPYCSSDSWSGTLRAGRNDEFSFMGSLIVEEVVKELLSRGLARARKLILAGSSAGGTGVLMNLDRISSMMSREAPGVEVRGIADSGWFLDKEPFQSQNCVEAYNCAPTDGIKKGIEFWQARVPEACQVRYPESERWRCYFGYRMYPTLKTPVYVAQYLFDEAQITVDNVFSGGGSDGAIVTRPQWEYIHRLGQDLKQTLENVSAVFAPACLSHEILTKSFWQSVTVNDVTLAQSIYCWENSFEQERCLTSRMKILLQREEPLGDDPSNRSKKRDKKRKRKNKRRKGKKHKRRRNNRNKRKRGKRSRLSCARHAGNCHHHLIDTCPLPQCNCSCPKYRNRFTGVEMDFFKLFVKYGIDKPDLAEILGIEVSTINAMDDDNIAALVLEFVRHKT